MEENILEVKDLYVDYETSEGVVYAVNGLNFSMKKGQILGLVGETGAGKAPSIFCNTGGKTPCRNA